MTKTKNFYPLIIIGVVLIINIMKSVGIDHHHHLHHNWRIINHHRRKVIIMLRMIKGG